MGTTLTGTKPKDTYDSLIKVEDNGPISGTAKYLSDGLGNNLPIAVSTTNVGIGTSAPAQKLSVHNGFIYNYGAQNASGFRHENIGGGHVVTLNANDSFAQLITTGATAIVIATSNTERLRVLSDGGLTFNGDTAQANALDDYEEGTWTPTTISAGYTISSSSGLYTKIGRQVTIRANVTFSAVSAGSNSSVNIGANPFTPSAVFTGLCRENTTTGAVYVTSITTANVIAINSMDGVTSGTQRTLAISESYIFTLTYFV